MSKPTPQFSEGDRFYIGGQEPMFETDGGATALVNKTVLYMEIDSISCFEEEGEWYDNVDITYYAPDGQSVGSTSVDIESINSRLADLGPRNESYEAMTDRFFAK